MIALQFITFSPMRARTSIYAILSNDSILETYSMLCIFFIKKRNFAFQFTFSKI
jgi:hypothetical protein